MTFLNNHVSCGGNWASGEDVFINNDVEPIRAKSLFPRGFVEIKPWFRLAPSPKLDILDAAIDAFDEGTRSQMTDTQASTLASQARCWSLCVLSLGLGVPRVVVGLRSGGDARARARCGRTPRAY